VLPAGGRWWGGVLSAACAHTPPCSVPTSTRAHTHFLRLTLHTPEDLLDGLHARAQRFRVSRLAGAARAGRAHMHRQLWYAHTGAPDTHTHTHTHARACCVSRRRVLTHGSCAGESMAALQHSEGRWRPVLTL
jgi:hypothetical protein